MTSMNLDKQKTYFTFLSLLFFRSWNDPSTNLLNCFLMSLSLIRRTRFQTSGSINSSSSYRQISTKTFQLSTYIMPTRIFENTQRNYLDLSPIKLASESFLLSLLLNCMSTLLLPKFGYPSLLVSCVQDIL